MARHSQPVDEDADLAAPLRSDGPAPDAGLLRDYEGLDHGTIAQMVGASDAAVRKRYSRALARLGELLQDVWP